MCNPVEITFKQTTRFVDSVLQPAQTLGTVAWHNPPERTFAIEKLGSSFQFRVAQRTRPDGKFHPLFRSPFAPSLQGRTEIYVEDVVSSC